MFCDHPSVRRYSEILKIETIKARKRIFISDDFQQLSVKLVTSEDSRTKSTDLSRAGNWCFQTETEEPTQRRIQ